MNHLSQIRMRSPQQGKGRGVKGDKSQHHDSKEKAPQKNDGPKDGKKEAKCQHNCFLCGGDHWVRDCPKTKAFNAMFSETEKKQQEVPPAEAANMGCLKLFNVLNAKQIPGKVQDKSLMHVEATINKKRAQVLIDTIIFDDSMK